MRDGLASTGIQAALELVFRAYAGRPRAGCGPGSSAFRWQFACANGARPYRKGSQQCMFVQSRSLSIAAALTLVGLGNSSARRMHIYGALPQNQRHLYCPGMQCTMAYARQRPASTTHLRIMINAELSN